MHKVDLYMCRTYAQWWLIHKVDLYTDRLIHLFDLCKRQTYTEVRLIHEVNLYSRKYANCNCVVFCDYVGTVAPDNTQMPTPSAEVTVSDTMEDGDLVSEEIFHKDI